MTLAVKPAELQCLFIATFWKAFLTSKVDETDLVFGADQGSLVVLSDYKAPCAAFTICATLVNIQTHIHTHRQTSNATDHHRGPKQKLRADYRV